MQKEEDSNCERSSSKRSILEAFPFATMKTRTINHCKPTNIDPVLSTKEPVDSLIMGDEHLDTIPEKESDELIKSSVENLFLIPSESGDFSENESECDMPVCDDFITFSNPLFDSNDDFTSSDDESLSDEDVPMENFKIYSNHLFVFDYLLEEFSGELAHIDPIPPGIEKADFDLEEEIRLVENFDSLMEEIDLFLASDDSMPPGIEDDDYDSEGDIHFLEELLNNDSLPLPKNESSILDHFNDPSSPRPPPKPPDVEICFDFEPDTAVKNDFDELNDDNCFDPGGGEIVVSQNVEDDDSFTFVIRTFLPFLTYPADSPLLLSTGSEDTIFDPGIST
ncbi:hypothetical protein Tco_0571350 [Tanacetum coccineum]